MMTKTSGHDTQQNSLLSKDGVVTFPEEGWSPDRSLSQKTHLALLKNTQIFVAESSHTCLSKQTKTHGLPGTQPGQSETQSPENNHRSEGQSQWVIHLS